MESEGSWAPLNRPMKFPTRSSSVNTSDWASVRLRPRDLGGLSVIFSAKSLPSPTRLRATFASGITFALCAGFPFHIGVPSVHIVPSTTTHSTSSVRPGPGQRSRQRPGRPQNATRMDGGGQVPNHNSMTLAQEMGDSWHMRGHPNNATVASSQFSLPTHI